MIHRLINLVELEPNRYKRMNMIRELKTLQDRLEQIKVQ